jgi:hypothetical protein
MGRAEHRYQPRINAPCEHSPIGRHRSLDAFSSSTAKPDQGHRLSLGPARWIGTGQVAGLISGTGGKGGTGFLGFSGLLPCGGTGQLNDEPAQDRLAIAPGSFLTRFDVLQQNNTTVNALSITIALEEIREIEAVAEPVRTSVRQMFERYNPNHGNGDQETNGSVSMTYPS